MVGIIPKEGELPPGAPGEMIMIETSFLAIFGPKYRFETKIVSMKPYWNQQKTADGFWNQAWFQKTMLWFQWNHMNLTLGAVIVKTENRNYVK